MWIFFKELCFVILSLCALGLIGTFTILPFRNIIRYSFLLTPLAGLLVLSVGTTLFYTLLAFPIYTAAGIAAVISIIFGLMGLFYIKPKLYWNQIIIPIIIAISVIAITTYLTEYVSIQLGQPSFLMMHGSDHLGYAQLADWLNTHLVTQPPLSDENIPYQSWPAFMFHADPRFGSFFILAIIASLRKTSGMFAYAPTFAIVLSASYCAVAAVFASRKQTLLLLFLGLLVGAWYALGASGYFGKILGYPSAFLIAGLLLRTAPSFTVPQVTALALLTCAAASSYPGVVIALFLTIIGGSYLAAQICFMKTESLLGKIYLHRDFIIVLGVLVIIAIASMGLLSRPPTPPEANWINALPHATLAQANWTELLPRALDLERFPPEMTFQHMTLSLPVIIFMLASLITLVAILVCICLRNSKAFACLVSFTLFFIIVVLFKKDWLAIQLVGTCYPLLLCGMVCLLDDNQRPVISLFIASLLLLSIALRIPQIIISIKNYAGPQIELPNRHTQGDMDTLAKLMENKIVQVNLHTPYQALPILVELGRRNLKFQWTAAAWFNTVGYRKWPLPIYNKKPDLYLETIDMALPANCTPIFKTIQYQLLKCK